MGISEGEEREKETEAINEAIMTENFPQINIRHQTTHPGSSESSKQDKCPKNLHVGMWYSNFRKSQVKGKS